MAKKFDRKIVLKDGSEYYGYAFGARETRVLEAVFNTSCVGYQEIMSDPAYTGQLVVMAYPIIGNYGVCDEDYETKVPALGAFAVRDYNDHPSNFRCTKTLSGVMEECSIPGIYGFDTRELVTHLRDNGTMLCCICDADLPVSEAKALIEKTGEAKDLVKQVSTPRKWYSKTAHPRFNVVAVDCGIRLSVVKNLNKLGCNVTVVPYDTAAEEILGMSPDGVFLSDGPGNPENVKETVAVAKRILGKVPVFAAGLGHEILALAYGAKTEKMKAGHRGSNYPVRDVKTGKIYVTSQNHSYTVSEESLKKTPLTVTREGVQDGGAEGLECVKDKAFSVQYYPDAQTYAEFIALMEENRNA